MFKKLSCLLMLALILVGCAGVQYASSDNQKASAKLDSSASVYIARPANAMYGTKICQGSGYMVGKIIKKSFSRHLSKVELSKEAISEKEALGEAKRGGFTYFIYADVLCWEDHATEWNGKPDKAEVKMVIFNVSSGNIIDSSIVKKTGPWMTVGGHPKDILRKPMDKYISSLFATK